MLTISNGGGGSFGSYMQCIGIQGIYNQFSRGVHLPPIYIYNVVVCKGSIID